MNPPKYPAAYLTASSVRGQADVSMAARQRGWPEPDVYADRPDAGNPGPALTELAAAVAAGRHDGLLLAMPTAADSATMRLLASCTKHGVRVSFIPPDPVARRRPRPRAPQ
jgi:hypothetical protein